MKNSNTVDHRWAIFSAIQTQNSHFLNEHKKNRNDLEEWDNGSNKYTYMKASTLAGSVSAYSITIINVEEQQIRKEFFRFFSSPISLVFQFFVENRCLEYIPPFGPLIWMYLHQSLFILFSMFECDFFLLYLCVWVCVCPGCPHVRINHSHSFCEGRSTINIIIWKFYRFRSVNIRIFYR